MAATMRTAKKAANVMATATTAFMKEEGAEEMTD
jgi:hypothetical protein